MEWREEVSERLEKEEDEGRGKGGGGLVAVVDSPSGRGRFLNLISGTTTSRGATGGARAAFSGLGERDNIRGPLRPPPADKLNPLRIDSCDHFSSSRTACFATPFLWVSTTHDERTEGPGSLCDCKGTMAFSSTDFLMAEGVSGR